jgi:DNA-damage-inducible protein D
MKDLDIFHFDQERHSFEDLGRENGFTYWLASDLQKMLGYENYNTFFGVINKAIAVSMSLGIPIQENFVQHIHLVDGKEISDFKLSRFACFLTTMNGDDKKPNVASAKVYFASLASACAQYDQDVERVERVVIRDEISDREKTLSGTVKSAGVTNYAYFQGAGYRGMYNMPLAKLRTLRGIREGKTPLDYMGKTELAANLFRITQTEEKVKNESIQGQQRLEVTAEVVGREVRDAMIRISGTPPESLPVLEPISIAKKELKKTHKKLKDSKPQRKSINAPEKLS